MGASGSWRRVRRAVGEVAPETIERIAQRVVQLLGHSGMSGPAPQGLVDASRLEEHLGLSRAWVYEHAHELGAVRIGTGPKARLRFDLHKATEALQARLASHV